MEVKRLIKALEKEGYQIDITPENGVSRAKYKCKSERKFCEWYSDSFRPGEVQMLHAGISNQNSDSREDYFSGWFPKTIKGLIEYMKD